MTGAEVRAGDPGLLGHGVVAVMGRDRLDHEVGHTGEVLGVVPAHGFRAVEDSPVGTIS